MNIINYGIIEKYNDLSRFGARFSEIGKQIDWESLRPIFDDLYVNDTDKGGRPKFDPVMMAKVLFIQIIYNLVDESVEWEINDRISFMHFLGFPDRIPDSRTIWLFHERLSSPGKGKAM